MALAIAVDCSFSNVVDPVSCLLLDLGEPQSCRPEAKELVLVD